MSLSRTGVFTIHPLFDGLTFRSPYRQAHPRNSAFRSSRVRTARPTAVTDTCDAPLMPPGTFPKMDRNRDRSVTAGSFPFVRVVVDTEQYSNPVKQLVANRNLPCARCRLNFLLPMKPGRFETTEVAEFAAPRQENRAKQLFDSAPPG